VAHSTLDVDRSLEKPTGSYAMPRGLIVLLSAAAAVVALAGMRAAAGILGPVFLALMLTVTATPLSGWLRRRGAPAWVAVTATVVATYLIVISLAAAVAVSVSKLVALLPSYADQFDALRSDLAAALGRLGADEQAVRDALSGVDPSTVLGFAGWLLGGVAGALSNAFFLLALLLFMGLDAGQYPARLLNAARQRPQIVSALRSFAHGTRQYLLVSTVFGLIVAVIDTLVLWALGVPLPLLWGLLAFITNYIPNVGFIIGLVPPALLGLLEGGPDLMLTVIILYSVINFVIQSIIQPKFVGDAVGLSATLSFLSLVFWAWVIGPLGALLAIPLSLLLKAVLIDIDPSSQWIGGLISGDPTAAEQEDPPEATPPEPEPRRPDPLPADASN
jgi:predicted PurR-regulated permease PerM